MDGVYLSKMDGAYQCAYFYHSYTQREVGSISEQILEVNSISEPMLQLLN